MLVRTPFAAGVRTLTEGVRSSRPWTISIGEAKRIAEGPMIDELNAEFIGILVIVSSRAMTWISESFCTCFELLVLLLCEDAVWPNAQVGSTATAPAAVMAQKSGDSFINRINSLLKLKKSEQARYRVSRSN